MSIEIRERVRHDATLDKRIVVSNIKASLRGK